MLLVSLTTGSFGLAGLLTAAGTLTGAVVAPLWGRAIDRVGQARVLLCAALINILSVALLVTAIELAWPLAVSVAGAVGVGARLQPGRIGRTRALDAPAERLAAAEHRVRSRGHAGRGGLHHRSGPGHLSRHRAPSGARGQRQRCHRAHRCCRAGRPAQQPAADPVDAARPCRTRSRLPWRVLVPVAIACAALGMVFGGMEVNVVAFAKEAGVLAVRRGDLDGLGLRVTGRWCRHWERSAGTRRPAKRFRVGATLLAVSLLPLPFVSHPVALALLLIAQRNGHRANPDRLRCGHPVLGGPDAADRGTWHGLRLVWPLASAVGAAARWPRDRQLGRTSRLRCRGRLLGCC